MLSLEETEDVEVDDEVVMYAEAFCSGKMYFCGVKLSPDKKWIVPDETRCPAGPPACNNTTYRNFCASLPNDECSLNAVFFNVNGQNKIIYITWCPEGCNYRDALLLNITGYAFRKLVNPDLNVKASDKSDLSEDEIREQLETGRPPTAIGSIFKQDDFKEY